MVFILSQAGNKKKYKISCEFRNEKERNSVLWLSLPITETSHFSWQGKVSFKLFFMCANTCTCIISAITVIKIGSVFIYIFIFFHNALPYNCLNEIVCRCKQNVCNYVFTNKNLVYMFYLMLKTLTFVHSIHIHIL